MRHSPPSAAIVLTYSARACQVDGWPRMDFWMSPVKGQGADPRNLWVGFAHFETYRPSTGSVDNDCFLSDVAGDTMAAIYAPPAYIQRLAFVAGPGQCGQLDMRRTLRGWLRECGAFPVVTYGA